MDRIASWLRTVPESLPPPPNDVERFNTPPRNDAVRPAKRRRPLSEMDTNIAPLTPSKTARTTAHASTLDQDTTPRPLAAATLPAALPQAIPPPPSSPSASGSNASTTSCSSTGTGKRYRDGSPVKGLSLLRHAEQSMVSKEIDALEDLPPELRDLTACMMDVQESIGILSDLPDDKALTLVKASLRNCNSVTSTSRGQIGQEPSLKFAQKIVENARDCEAFRQCEAAWNDSVHSCLLAEALQLWRYHQQTRMLNISTAGVIPQFLPVVARGERVDSKRVDYCLAVNITPRTQDLIMQTPAIFTHSSYEPLKVFPIAVSVETKASGKGDEEAILQLSTWVMSHFAFLRHALARAGHPATTFPPPHPMLLAEGSVWYFYIARPLPEGRAERWSRVMVGNVKTIRGVFQVVAALQHLARWTAEHYAPWFQTHILTPQLSTQALGGVVNPDA